MKVFLSWSGKTSREVAQALSRLAAVRHPGGEAVHLDRRHRQGQALERCPVERAERDRVRHPSHHPDNFDKPWLHFEAGAISRRSTRPTCRRFFNIDPLRVVGPLSQFQATINDPDDILRLLISINSRLPDDQRLSFDVLSREFELLWPDLKKKLDKAAETQDLETHTGFPWLYNARRRGAAAGRRDDQGGLDRHRATSTATSSTTA